VVLVVVALLQVPEILAMVVPEDQIRPLMQLMGVVVGVGALVILAGRELLAMVVLAVYTEARVAA
jgi:NADH:ubiquinone oxidoreductase subunit 6 (subunit J)